MKLPKPFFRLPLTFDAGRLAAEVNAIPDAAWSSHPTGYPGNSAVRLISVMRQFEMLQRAVSLGGEMNRRAIEEVAKV